MIDLHTGKPVIFFDADAGGGGNSDPDNADKGKKKTDGGDDDAAKQKALDAQFADRAKRAGEAERKKLFEALGVKDDTEFEAYLKSKKEAEDQQKTETQKLADAAKKAQADLEKEKSTAAEKLAAMQKRVLDQEIKMIAAQPVKDKDGKITRAAFRADALDDVLLVIDRSEIEEKDGKYEGIDKALAKLAKAKTYYLEADQPSSVSKGTPRSGSGGKTQPTNQPNDDWFNSL